MPPDEDSPLGLARQASWEVQPLHTQVKHRYGVTYEEKVLPPTEIGSRKLVLECSAADHTWASSHLWSAYMYENMLARGEAWKLWEPVWQAFLEHLHSEHIPTGLGKCPCTPLMKAQSPASFHW